MNPLQSDLYDVAIIGGGPAGATAAALLAERGRKVLVLEKSSHPRFHIGESLLPKNLPILERLGVLDDVKAIGIYKPGAVFVSPDHEERQGFRFSEALDPDPPYAYQVHRSEFDEILLRKAQDSGSHIQENCTVTDVQFGDALHAVTYRHDGHDLTCQARFVVDATGRDGFLARRMDVRHQNKDHNSAAIFAHFDGIPDDALDPAGSIGLFWFDHGWIWMIPLTNGKTSIGAVCMPDYLKSRRGGLEEFYFDTLRLCPKMWDIVKDAELGTPVRAAGNYSYKASRAYGPGYLLLGDSYAFVDPVFSSGVFLAMSSAERAAGIIDQVLDHPERANRLFANYKKQIDRGISRFSWFIYRFNTPALRFLFMGPRNTFGMRQAVISMLAGDVYINRGLGWRLTLFRILYGILWLMEFRKSLRLDKRRTRLSSISVPENEVAGQP